MAKDLSIDAADIASLFSSWNPGAGAPARLDKLSAADFSKALWELDMARKDEGLMMNAANEKGVKLTVLQAVAAEMDNWIANGHGCDDWSIIAKENV